MLVVYYSLKVDADGTRERQWARSVDSLRRHNSDVPVVLCLYGDVRPETLAIADRARVHVQQMGEFADAFGDIPAHWREALTTHPTLHKLLSLRAIVSADQLCRVLYLDCDTYLYSDIGQLDVRYGGCDWYAREEPYIDEQVLSELARCEGLVSLPLYNTGVVLLTAALARTLVTLLDDFVWYSWRLLLGIFLWQPELVGDQAQVALVRAQSGAGECRLALPYPSRNAWILEEIATSLTLGRVTGLTHGVLRRPDVVQGEECYTREAGSVVAHYFTAGEAAFFATRDGTV